MVVCRGDVVRSRGINKNFCLFIYNCSTFFGQKQFLEILPNITGATVYSFLMHIYKDVDHLLSLFSFIHSFIHERERSIDLPRGKISLESIDCYVCVPCQGPIAQPIGWGVYDI